MMAFLLSFAIYVSLKEKASESQSPRLHDGSGRRGSNPRPSAWKADALPTELLPQFGPLFSKGLQRYNFLLYVLQVVDNFLGFLGRNR